MKIGIIGTRGIPNKYGGFEQFAEKFASAMAARGHDITVYCSGNHPYKETSYKNVNLVHISDPEPRIGTAGQFVYDLNCILHSRKQRYDIILQLGYTSSTVWSWLFPDTAVLATNMDGLEWKRAKYGPFTRKFLHWAERWGAVHSDHLIADSKAIAKYLSGKYNRDAVVIPYGADVYIPEISGANALVKLGLFPGAYDLLIARFEPENNIETMLKTYARFPHRRLVLIGNYKATRFGRKMFEQYGRMPQMVFAGSEYNQARCDELRYHSRMYLHGHSVGGTNPSLLEAMACQALICAHRNDFNTEVLGKNAFYFNGGSELEQLVNSKLVKGDYENWMISNKLKIQREYNWETIVSKLEQCFMQWISGNQPVSIA
jgi:glycosyltransferase involved in cell wall biosynthesis